MHTAAVGDGLPHATFAPQVQHIDPAVVAHQGLMDKVRLPPTRAPTRAHLPPWRSATPRSGCCDASLWRLQMIVLTTT
jgi:hypothetical protein